MPQGLIVADSFCRGGDSLLVQNAPCAEVHGEAKPLENQPAEDLQLDLPHQADMNLLEAFVPDDVELRVLLRQETELVQCCMRIRAFRQEQTVVQHRFQLWRSGGCLRSQPLTGEGVVQTCDGADRTCLRLLQKTEAGAGAEPQLFGLFLPGCALPVCTGEERFGPEAASGDFHPGQPRTLRIPADFENLGSKLGGVALPGGVPGQALQKLAYPRQFQRGAEPAGEYSPGPDQLPERSVRKRPRVQIFRQSLLAGGGGLLPHRIPGSAKVHKALSQPAGERGQQGFPVCPGQIHFVDE